MTQGISATITAAHSQSDELRPIRIGAMAQQPAPDATIIYVGLALLLPVRLRAICCAGLFYAHVVDEQQDGRFELLVGALPHYLVDPAIYGSHLHTCTISYRELDQLLEWDRCLAVVATCDLRDRVAEHATQSRRSIHAYTQLHAVKEISTRDEDEMSVTSDCTLPSAPLDASAGAQERPVKRLSASPRRQAPALDDMQFTRTEIEVPMEDLQAILSEHMQHLNVGDHQYRPSLRRMNVTLLRAGVQHLKDVRLQTVNWQKKRELREKEQGLRQALSWGDLYPPQVEVTPIYARGKHGSMVSCQMMVDVPVLAA